ncbi:MAG: hypothetical protein QW666_03625 [Candidatus Woesearchaeota archaeon]
MSRKEFEEELGAYLKSKRKKKIDVVGMIKGIMPKPTPPPVKLPPEIQVYGEEEQAGKKIEEKAEDTPYVEAFEEPKTEVEEYPAEVKKPFWHTVLEKVGFKGKETQKEDEMLRVQSEEEKIKGIVEKEFLLKDLKNLAKITLFVIKQLPKERMEQFKQSSDFTDLKEMLKKYKLIK